MKAFRLLSALVVAALLSTAIGTFAAPLSQWSPKADGVSALQEREGSPTNSMTYGSDESPKQAHFGRNSVVRGVNLGAWFVLESWQNPSLFLTQDIRSMQLNDEWSWMNAKGSKAQEDLVEHYRTFMNQSDFEAIQRAGLSTVRIPVPFWTFVPTVKPEPYLASRQRKALRDALIWSKQYGLDVVLDLHTVPGSVNGLDNGGRLGEQAFADDPNNAKRALNALSVMTDMFVNNASYGGVVKAIQVANEPKINERLSWSVLQNYQAAALKTIRAAIKPSATVVPTVLFSDAFQPWSKYDALLPSDAYPTSHIAVDHHQYFVRAWDSRVPKDDDELIDYVCAIGPRIAAAQKKRAVIVGEFSLGRETRCVDYHTCQGVKMSQDVSTLNSAENNNFMRRFFEAQAASYEKGGGWIMWSWKTESAAAWSYSAAREQGWIPDDVSDPAQWLYRPADESQRKALPDDLHHLRF
ncbi:GLUCAN 1,3-BETA-GLUCOSIDASE I/II-RELATED [Ceraceosorus bombacis]|uniref:GLUCAN 1,3-BETA-GLUCOSIDASE I/II-RELATED n=1 Tax=Ceraceosorus bombacis TaxID=401625 RepID=A0A0P1B8K2_9BASI|nr:GLUCAN 1,3-BETA-GLUCOSIDASE I/II-RELATED [Ceraceosorus bombacis]